MNIESFSGAATVALASTVLFVLVAKSWHVITKSVGSAPNFSDSIMREAAQRFRDEFDRLSRSQSTYLSAALVFVVVLIAAYILRADRIFSGYPQWQLILLVGLLAVAAIVALQRLIRTAMARREIKLRRDANIAIGHQLQRMANGIGRTYHDVETSAGIIDHLIVGPNGTYAVTVIAKPAQKNGEVEIHNNEVIFSPRPQKVSIVPTNARIASIEREFRRLLDHRVRVRSVIATPGWEVTGQASDEHLLVNERSLPMLRGWKDRADHLMNEDVDALHQLLTERCGISDRKR
ncbi:MAG: hypothetical protein AAF351_05380 [Pseudomonadota bacterium]